MRILVTGGAGYIGSHFCKQAYLEHHKVIVYDNLSTGHKEFVKWGPLVKGDLQDTSLLLNTLKEHQIEAVIHFAAKSLVEESVKFPDLYFHNNVEGTASLLQAMSEASTDTLVFSSSAATYGVPQHIPIKESDPQTPINPYGESKLKSEKLILDWQAKAPQKRKISILRYFNVIGQDPQGELYEKHEPETHLVPNIFLALESKKEFYLYGTQHKTPDGTCVRDYVDVTDLGKVHLEALIQIQKLNHSVLISNVGTGRGYSVREVFQAFERVFKKAPKLVEKPPRAGDPASLVADDHFLRTWSQVKMKNLEESIATLQARK